MCPSLPFFGQDSQKENLQLFQKWKTNAYFHFRSIIARNSYIFCITYFNKKKMKWLYPKTCSFKMQLVEIGYFRTQNVVFLILVLVHTILLWRQIMCGISAVGKYQIKPFQLGVVHPERFFYICEFVSLIVIHLNTCICHIWLIWKG